MTRFKPLLKHLDIEIQAKHILLVPKLKFETNRSRSLGVQFGKTKRHKELHLDILRTVKFVHRNWR